MIPVLTKEQAYKLDKDTIESGHLSQEELMDNAGKAVAQFFCEKIDNPFNQEVVVVCGKGNNGGDGVIAHSYLKLYNVSSKIVFTEEKHGHSKFLKKYKISRNEYSIYSDKTNFDNYDWIVDAIFGIGFKCDKEYYLDPFIEEIIFKMIHNTKFNKHNQITAKLLDKYYMLDEPKGGMKYNYYPKNIIAIDIPSSFLANGGYVNTLVGNYSSFTLALGYPKLGYFDDTHREQVSTIVPLDIGFKDIINHNINLIDKNDVTDIIKKYRVKLNKHKYTNSCGVVAGSDKYSGAAILACNAAYSTGSSYIKLFSPSSKETMSIIDSQLHETVLVQNENDFYGYHACLLGPGLDINLSFKPSHCDYYVLDAGALCQSTLNDYEEGIFTPHFGECEKLFSFPHEEHPFDSINKELIEVIQSKINNKQVIVLKGPSMFIITKEIIYIMDRGPSLLATAGTGDVLSGILVSLLSQGYSRLEASILGTYLHAEAANYYMNNISKDGMTASDLIDCIPHAFNILRENE